MSKIFLIDTNKKPLNPIHPATARQLLRNKKAAIFRRFPFTLILKEAKPDTEVESLRLKIDPGSKTTGFALVNDLTGEVVFASEIQHRGFQIRDAVRSTGSFNISTKDGLIQGISYKYCKCIHKKDGYCYTF
jgi:hypothetical protein